MILLIDAEKSFDKVQHPFVIKTLHSVGIQGIYLNIIKIIYENPPENIILNGEMDKEDVVCTYHRILLSHQKG